MDEPNEKTTWDGWEKQDSTTMWLPKEEGETLVGTVVDIVEGTYGYQYYVLPEGQDLPIATPSHKVLQNRMTRVQKGDLVKIQYDGLQPPKVRGQSPTRLYDVYVKKSA